MQPFELFAIRYGHHGPRKANDNMIGGDLHEAHSDLDYFVWVAKRSDRVFLIDTGMNEEASKRRSRELIRAPADAVKLLGLDATKLEDVILTHLHFDHAGTLDRFPKARFHVQDTEVAYATGRCMCSGFLRHPYDVGDVVHLVKCVYADRVTFHNQSAEITSGLSVHRTGGHSGGLQVVRVFTERGWVVVASDASHLYMNMRKGIPFPAVHRVDEMMEGYRIVHELANGSWDHVVPGHDPLVMKMYPAPSKELEGIVVRLDKPPVGSLPF